VTAAHACNPYYSGDKDQEDCGLKPAGAISFLRPYLKKSFTKIGLVVWLKVKALSLSSSTKKQKTKKKKKKKERKKSNVRQQALGENKEFEKIYYL
jgi:hypothetical protein